MKRIVFITARDAAYGFALAGLTQHITDPAGVEVLLGQVMAAPENGLAIVDERLVGGLPEERLREMERGWSGILLVLPSPERIPAAGEDYAARLIRRAIGYHVKLSL